MKTATLTRALCTLALAAALSACAAPEPTKEGRPRAASQPTPAAPQAPTAATLPSPAATEAPGAQPSSAPQAARQSPPDARDVRAAVERTYKGAVTLEERAAVAAAVGDFNGDGSEDLIVEARPAPGRVSDLNDEFANWIVSDPRAVGPQVSRASDPRQGARKVAPRSGRPQVEAGDALLVVVHGYKEAGWRNPEALQTYLLRGAAGTEMRVEPRAIARLSTRGRIPRLLGDVLSQRLEGRDGFLYWTGSTYGWLY